MWQRIFYHISSTYKKKLLTLGNKILSSFTKHHDKVVRSNSLVTKKSLFAENATIQTQNRCSRLENYIYFLMQLFRNKILTNPLFNSMPGKVKIYPKLKLSHKINGKRGKLFFVILLNYLIYKENLMFLG